MFIISTNIHSDHIKLARHNTKISTFVMVLLHVNIFDTECVSGFIFYLHVKLPITGKNSSLVIAVILNARYVFRASTMLLITLINLHIYQ